MLGCVYYGSTNETYKIAYGKPTFSPRFGEHELFQVRKLPSFEKTPHRLLFLRFLPWEKGFGFDKKDRKEAKESQSKKGRVREIDFLVHLIYGKQAPFQINSASDSF